MIGRFRALNRTIRSSVRWKLVALTIFPVALVVPIALAGLTAWGASFTYDQLYIKVNTDLAVAHDLFERLQQDQLGRLARLGESYAFRDAMARDDGATIDHLVAVLRRDARLSFLRVLPATEAGTVSAQSQVGIEILGPEDLRALDPALEEAVRLPIVDTERAGPTNRQLEDRAMVIRSRHPVIDGEGNVSTVIDGGVMLNNNFAFVDAIRDLVYGPGSLPTGSIGTVTVFLDDVRITTNVAKRAGERALGTRVSDEVSRSVLGRGETWIDRAFVVNDWYISAYEPIIDIHGERVGILYAGYLEAPFRNAFWNTLWLILLLLLVSLALYAVLAVRGATSIFKPVEKMSQVVRGTREGQQLRVGKIESEDELAELAREFDDMLDRLALQAREMKQWANQLEDKVDERTAELQRRNDELQHTIDVLRETRRKLVTAEKLAALGELTAGVAHEINNPTQVMLGNLDVLVEELGDRLDPVRPEVDLVIEQIYRIQAIIDKLLKYARPGDYAGYLIEVDVNQVVDDTLGLIGHMQKQRDFDILLDLQATRPITINPQELQQVLVNLASNAVHALPHLGGKLRFSSHDWADDGVCITVTDNGQGMDKDQCNQIFNPFYSTKGEGSGTGLGLSVSYGLIRRYGGDITVDSHPGRGSSFHVRLLMQPQMTEDVETIAEQLHDFEADKDARGDTAG